MQIRVNGEMIELFEGTTLFQWLQNQGEERNTLIIEHNGQIITEERLRDITLQDGDELEVFKFVGGG